MLSVQEKKTETESISSTHRTIGKIERISPEINFIIPENAVIEVLADGLEWAEGPLWIPEKKWLLCSDVKENKIFKWKCYIYEYE